MFKYLGNNYVKDPTWGWTRVNPLDELCENQRWLYVWDENPNFKWRQLWNQEYLRNRRGFNLSPRYSYTIPFVDGFKFRRLLEPEFRLLENDKVVFISTGGNQFEALKNGINLMTILYPEWFKNLIPKKKEALLTSLNSLRLIRSKPEIR